MLILLELLYQFTNYNGTRNRLFPTWLVMTQFSRSPMTRLTSQLQITRKLTTDHRPLTTEYWPQIVSILRVRMCAYTHTHTRTHTHRHTRNTWYQLVEYTTLYRYIYSYYYILTTTLMHCYSPPSTHDICVFNLLLCEMH